MLTQYRRYMCRLDTTKGGVFVDAVFGTSEGVSIVKLRAWVRERVEEVGVPLTLTILLETQQDDIADRYDFDCEVCAAPMALNTLATLLVPWAPTAFVWAVSVDPRATGVVNAENEPRVLAATDAKR